MMRSTMPADYASWGVAILVSMFMHSLIFMQSGARIGAENASVMQAPMITRLNFQMLEAQPVPEEPPPVEKPRPKPVKKEKPRPVPVKQKKPPPVPVEKPEPVVQPVAQPQARGQQVVQPSEGLLQRKRQQYLHELLKHIESHKFYPRAARRRAVEGRVNIVFVLQDDGYYEQLELDGRHKLLVNAARQALEAARPLPVPPVDIGLSRRIEFTIEYSLAD